MKLNKEDLFLVAVILFGHLAAVFAAVDLYENSVAERAAERAEIAK
jgi:hypothetical protein